MILDLKTSKFYFVNTTGCFLFKSLFRFYFILSVIHADGKKFNGDRYTLANMEHMTLETCALRHELPGRGGGGGGPEAGRTRRIAFLITNSSACLRGGKNYVSELQ